MAQQPERLSQDFRRLTPTHSASTTIGWHFRELFAEIDRMQAWIEETMPSGPSLEELREKFIRFEQERLVQQDIGEQARIAYETANPAFMSADGIHRYWRKVRMA
jgi:hypothetical protein